jgi:hypothetical protein
MVTKYFDKSGKELTKDRWSELQKDEDYCIIHSFENDRFLFQIKWFGKVDNADNLFRHSYPMFVSNSLQYDEATDDWIEAIDSGRTFGALSSATTYYEDFLLTYTDASVDEDGEITSSDNLQSKPKPIEPPKPSAVPLGEYDEMVW